MKILKRKKVVGIVISAIILVLILSILTPAFGIQNKAIPPASTPGGGSKETTIPSVNTGYGDGYVYGYGYTPHFIGY